MQKSPLALLARVLGGAALGSELVEDMKTTKKLQKVAPFTPSRKRHDDDLGSEPEVEKTFHDDIDTGADFADVATTIGAALLGAYLGRKAGKKIGRGLSGLSDALKGTAKKSTGNIIKGTADYQQATTWPQQKQLAEKQPMSGGRWAGDEVRSSGDTQARIRAKKIAEASKRKKALAEKSVAGDVGEAVGSTVGRTAGEAVGKKFSKQDNPFAIATSQAKKMGYDDFSERSAGKKKRGEIAEAIKEDSSVDKLLKAVEGLKEGLVDGGQAGDSYSDSSENIDKPKKKSELIPEDHRPPEAFMTKEADCGCDGYSTAKGKK